MTRIAKSISRSPFLYSFCENSNRIHYTPRACLFQFGVNNFLTNDCRFFNGEVVFVLSNSSNSPPPSPPGGAAIAFLRKM
ncbi:hypothetical protein HMPREF0262_01784 [Clostridium sp. ATCC 29733]|nr:hypothetical protein HMPREF0262_01784 [Clostridium sp. ATCC 29733]